MARFETENYRGLSQRELVEKYKQIFSHAAGSKISTGPVSKVIQPSTGVGLITPLNISDVLGEGNVIRGEGIEFDSLNKWFVAGLPMYAVSISMFVTAAWANNATVSLGIGLGDPTVLPNTQGQIVSGSYISRFKDTQSGRGTSRPNTFKFNFSLVGKAGSDPESIGVDLGDKIFPVMWTEEISAQTVDIYDVILSVSRTVV